MSYMQFRLIAIALHIIMKCVSAETKEDKTAIEDWKNEVKKETSVEL